MGPAFFFFFFLTETILNTLINQIWLSLYNIWLIVDNGNYLLF